MGNCCDCGFVTGGPNEVLVKSGCCESEPFKVAGGRVWVWACCQRIQRLPLNTMTLVVRSEHVYSKYGVPITVTGIAQVKFQAQNAEMLDAACEQFLSMPEDEVKRITRETLEGHQRAIMGNMTVEEIYQDRKKFAKAVFEVASSDFVQMGINVVSYTLKDIRDDEGYLKALGMTRTAQVKRDARIGEAEARKEAGEREARAEEQRLASKYLNEVEIAKSQRDFELKKAAYDREIFTAKAQSELAYDLQAAKAKQRIREENIQIKVIERSQNIQVQEQEIVRRERELEATVKKPAEAEKYRMEKLAEAHKTKIIMEAEAAAQAIQMKGEAEAFAIEAKAKAEAEQMAKKADAWKEYQDAAMTDMVLDMLPKVAAEIAAPLATVKKITMVSSGKSEIGASKLTGEILSVMEKLPNVVCNMTGVDITKSMTKTQRRL